MNLELTFFISSGSLLFVMLVIQAFRLGQVGRRLRVRTALDKTIYERMKQARAVVMKAAHLDAKSLRRGLAVVLQVFSVITLYAIALVHDITQKVIRGLQGNTVRPSTGAASFFLKEVRHFKDEMVERS